MSDRFTGKQVLVAGGCGFFGSYLVPALLRAGANVVVVDNVENGERPVLDRIAGDIRVVEGDVRSAELCNRLMRGIDIFVNLAAKASGVGFSRTHHADMLVDNVLCGLVPMQAAVRVGVPHVVVTSSSCVYADDAPVPTPELDPVLGPPETVNEGYGWAKRIQELGAGYYAREHGVRVTILRPLNLYGGNYPWRSNEKAHVIPSIVKRVLDGEDPLVVWGSGQQRRNFLHGSDAAEVAARVIASGAEGPVNIGYEEATTIADLVKLVCDVTRRRPRIVFDTTKPDGHPHKAADATRLRQLTGNYVPAVTLRAGIEDMVEWYRRTFASSLK